MEDFSNEDLLAFADELLDPELSRQIEMACRDCGELRQRLQELLSGRDQGELAPGEVWKHHRLSCPSATDLSLYRLIALNTEYQSYIQFHLETIGCVYCLSQLAEIDAETKQTGQVAEQDEFRQTLYASTAGVIKPADSKS